MMPARFVAVADLGLEAQVARGAVPQSAARRRASRRRR